MHAVLQQAGAAEGSCGSGGGYGSAGKGKGVKIGVGEWAAAREGTWEGEEEGSTEAASAADGAVGAAALVGSSSHRPGTAGDGGCGGGGSSRPSFVEIGRGGATTGGFKEVPPPSSGDKGTFSSEREGSLLGSMEVGESRSGEGLEPGDTFAPPLPQVATAAVLGVRGGSYHGGSGPVCDSSCAGETAENAPVGGETAKQGSGAAELITAENVAAGAVRNAPGVETIGVIEGVSRVASIAAVTATTTDAVGGGSGGAVNEEEVPWVDMWGSLVDVLEVGGISKQYQGIAGILVC